MEDPEEAPGVDYVHVEEDTEVEETTVVDIATTSHPIRSDAMSTINLADVSLSKLRAYRDFVSLLSKYRLSWHVRVTFFSQGLPTRPC